jgi:hypothetical protein
MPAVSHVDNLMSDARRPMKTSIATVSVLVAGLLATGSFPVSADHDDDRPARFRARLAGVQEVPVVSTLASGELELTVDSETQLSYKLTYRGLEGGNTLFAHIHLAQPFVNGMVMTFLCGGGTKPDPCPNGGGTVEGTIVAADIQAILTQQIPAGGFEEFVRALRNGTAYANVHTTVSPGGEIRGQIFARGRFGD